MAHAPHAAATHHAMAHATSTHHPPSHAATAHHAVAHAASHHAAALAGLHLLGHFGQDALEREAAQGDFRALGPAAEIGPNVDPLAGGHHDVGAILRDFEQSAIDADDGEGRSITPAQFVDAGIGAVQDA